MRRMPNGHNRHSPNGRMEFMTTMTDNTVLQDYETVKNVAAGWKRHLDTIKADNVPEEFSWYGYDILANIWHLDRLLVRGNRDFLARIAGQPIADIGTADGDLGYFFESLGFEVDLIDWPATNWNSLRGARRLKDLLSSSVAIHEIDLDSQFRLPRERYGLVFLFGILYHLKNPFFVLEQLARSTRYCAISTRIARQTVNGKVALDRAPLAYLLAPDECNNDDTNYWIFSLPGLERLAERTGWRIVSRFTVGDTRRSNPSEPDHDERAFMLLESKRPEVSA